MRVSRGVAGVAGMCVAAVGCFSNAAAVGQRDGVSSGASELNLFGQTLQVLVALLLTIALLVGTVWLFKKILRGKTFPGVSRSTIQLLEIHYLDPKKAIALVKIIDRVLIVGYTESGMTALGELTPEEAARVEASGMEAEPFPFGAVLARFIKSGAGLKRDATGRGGTADVS